MSDEPASPHLTLRQLADDMKLAHAGRRDQAEIMRTQIAEHKSRRTPHDVERLEAQLPTLFRLARSLHVLNERRAEIPRWIVALLEDGVT